MKYQSLVCLFVLLSLVTVSYLPTFTGEFILDDHPLVNRNPFLKESQPLWSYFTQEDGIVAGEGSGDCHTGYYRPLVNISYSLDYKLWGMDAGWFRATNLLLHLTTCVFVFLLLAKHYQAAVALIIALFFGLHPANTEVVSWVSARNNIMVTLFSIVSFYFYAFRRGGQTKLYWAISVLFYALALLSKEYAVMLLPTFFVYNVVVERKPIGDRWKWVEYLPYVFVFVLYALLRWHVTESVLSPAEAEHSLAERIYFAPYLLMYYIRLILVPSGLHSFIVSYPVTLLCWEAAIGFAGLAFMGILVWRSRKEKMVVFPVAAFVVGLFPVLNVIPTSAVSIVSMRWLYFPFAFLVLFFAWALDRLFAWRKTACMTVAFSLLAYFGIHSYSLNARQWHNEWPLLHREVIEFHNTFYTGGLAELYHQKKDFEKAERYYRKAVLNLPDKAANQINYAALLVDLKRPQEALVHLEKAKILKMMPSEKGRLYNNEGMAYLQLGRLDDAVRSFEEAVRFCPYEPTFWGNLGGAYGNKGQYKESIEVLERGLRLIPESFEMRKNLAVSHMKMGAYAEAISVLEKAPVADELKSKEIEGLRSYLRNRLLQEPD